MFNRTKIISSLKTRNIPHFPREKQNELFKKAFEMSFKCIEPICNNIVDVNYRNNSLDNHNPLLWSYGHIMFFWEIFFCRFIYPNECYPLLENVDNLYDSFIVGETKYMTRFNDKNHSTQQLLEYSDKIFKYIEKWILYSKNQASFENYAFMTCLLHTHMHIECFIFDYQMFNMKNPLTVCDTFKACNFKDRSYLKIEMIPINGATYLQGSPNNGNSMVWDNELSQFEVFIKPFSVSKYPITQKQFLDFVTCGGYVDSKNWSIQGNAWRNKTRSICPVYWTKEKGIWYRLHFGKWVVLEYDYPMIHVNYYDS